MIFTPYAKQWASGKGFSIVVYSILEYMMWNHNNCTWPKLGPLQKSSSSVESDLVEINIVQNMAFYIDLCSCCKFPHPKVSLECMVIVQFCQNIFISLSCAARHAQKLQNTGHHLQIFTVTYSSCG